MSLTRGLMNDSRQRNEVWVSSRELSSAFERLENPVTDEDRKLAAACNQVRGHLKRLWANRRHEIEDWRKKDFSGRNRRSRLRKPFVNAFGFATKM